ncbi:MAG TPA: hypothetical protein VF185_01655 [Patescibacteria group bacterium]
MVKHLKLLLLFFVVALITGGMLLVKITQKEPVIPASVASNPTFPVTTQAAPQTTAMEAPDGSHTLTLKEEKGKSATTYTVLISTSNDPTQKQIFTKTLEEGSSISLPFNTFSPDDKYVFLKETTKSGISYIVLNSQGTPLTKENSVINFSDLFAAKYPDYKITEATGWASPTLIIINTDKLDGTQGPSFWFEIPSQSFLILSNRFN